MDEPRPQPQAMDATLHLVVRRLIAAPRERVFAAWTQPEHLKAWWGPAWVTCPEAEVDLRVGGRYRIANRTETGDVIWIAGHFERVEVPSRLVYSWAHEPITEDTELSRVTVRFEARTTVTATGTTDGTEVIVLHERLKSEATRDEHLKGWRGCLDGLEALLGAG